MGTGKGGGGVLKGDYRPALGLADSGLRWSISCFSTCARCVVCIYARPVLSFV